MHTMGKSQAVCLLERFAFEADRRGLRTSYRAAASKRGREPQANDLVKASRESRRHWSVWRNF